MPGSDFRISFTSVGGWVKGILRSMTPLSAAPSTGDPIYNNTDFVLWQPNTTGTSAEGDWDQYYRSCIMNMRDNKIEWGEIMGVLMITEHAVDFNTAATAYEIALHDEYGHPITDTTLCLRLWADNGQVLRFVMCRKEVSGGTTTYTAVTPVRGLAAPPSYGDQFVYLVGGMITTGGHIGYGGGLVWNQQRNAEYTEWYLSGGEVFVASDIAFKANLLGYMPDEELLDPTVGPPSDEGGYGPMPSGGGIGGSGGPDPTFDFTSDPIEISPLPPGISELGFINIYKCAAGSLNLLGATLFPDVSSATDVMSAITAMSDSIWNSKLIDYVISIHMVPADVPAGSDEDIKIGTRTLTGIKGAKVSSDYVEIDLGTLKVDEVYTNFNDYHTRARLFLPFYGYVEIAPEYWQSATLHVIYRINVVDGSFIAFVKSKIERHQPVMESLVGQYSGSACIHCPASGVSYASMFSGIASNAAGMAVNMAGGNVAGVASSALNVASASQGSMEHGGAYNSSASIMGHRYPYLIIERPVSQFPTDYGKEVGYPLWVSKTLGSCHGLTIAENIILDGIPCTQAEKEKIRQLFNSGVIIK